MVHIDAFCARSTSQPFRSVRCVTPLRSPHGMKLD